MQGQFKDAYALIKEAVEESPSGSKMLALEVKRNTTAAQLLKFLSKVSDMVAISQLAIIDKNVRGLNKTFALRGVVTWGESA